ncbi:MAG: DUF4136 domain-containing protein [Chryseolinea sp.]
MKNLFFVGLLMVLWSCEHEPTDPKLLDQLVVSTNYDTTAQFNTYATYALPTDTIGFSSNAHPNDTLLIASESSYPRPVLEAVKSNMNSLGFVRVDRSENPDLGVNVYVVNDLNLFQQVVYPNYYYPNYYGYSSYYYYPYVQTYTYNTGVLIIEIVDLKNRIANNKVKVIWNAYLGDVYSTDDLIHQSVVAIDQAFVQSPYLSEQ